VKDFWDWNITEDGKSLLMNVLKLNANFGCPAWRFDNGPTTSHRKKGVIKCYK
jgi:hypothetical protein